MSTHTHIQYETTASVGDGKLDLSDPNVKQAYEDVKNDKTKTNWCLLGYVPKTNKLEVVGSGSEGVQEMLEDLNEGTPGYAFVRFEIESSYGSKGAKVDITWAPDGVPATRKGLLHTHSEQISKFLQGHHVQINARTEEDIEEEAILEKIKRTIRR